MEHTARTEATTLDTREYKSSHGKAPRGHGYWGFRRPGCQAITWITGTLTECRAELGGGRWVVCP
jgi:hypothetical protein